MKILLSSKRPLIVETITEAARRIQQEAKPQQE
jgi:hypothetical protein